MKATKLTIKNIGPLKEIELPLNVPIIKLYGLIRQGKTSILNAVRYLTGTQIPNDLIRHGESEALIRIDFEGVNTFIERSFYIDKSGSVKARAIEFVKDSIAVKNPSKVLKEIRGEHVADQDSFNKLSIDDKKKYFVNALGVTTQVEDSQLFENTKQAKVLRSEIKAAGDLSNIEVVEKPTDISSLISERNEITTGNENLQNAFYEKQQARTAIIEGSTGEIANRKVKEARLAELQRQSKIIATEGQALQAELKNEIGAAVIPEEIPQPVLFSTTELDAQITSSGAEIEKYNGYLETLKRKDALDVKQKELSGLVATNKKLTKLKGDKLVALNDSHGIEGLVFHADGNITFLDTALDMLSTSQQFEISFKLASKQANDLGILLIDRAESLGTSIDKYIDHAEANNFTVLATIVGGHPAESVDEVGVYVVENGEIVGASKKPVTVAEKEIDTTIPVVEEKEPEGISNELSEVPDTPLDFDVNEFLRGMSKIAPAATQFFAIGYERMVTTKNITVLFKSVNQFQCHELNKPKVLALFTEHLQKFIGYPVSVTFYVKDPEEITENEVLVKQEEPVNPPVEDLKPDDSEETFDFSGSGEW